MSVVLDTPSGRLAGSEAAGVRSFLGIPFARPPVGERRFAAPQPAPPWSGTRDATAFGGSAPQAPMILPLPGMDVGRQDEDCLYLNVWTPADGGSGKPVLVWIHGGGFVIGSGSQTVYDGARLARRGDVVVVTVNYRLGALGFLHLAELCPELGAVSNPGMRDQVAALEWVARNIEAFGGDPRRVTIFGESAGGMSVGTLLGMPSARGLFQAAIPQSGACHHFHTTEVATRVAEKLLEALGVERRDAARALREMPASKLIESQAQTTIGLGTAVGLLPFMPVVDGDSLPVPALQAVREGAADGVPLLTGTTRDEWKLFTLMDPTLGGLDEAGLLARLGRDVPEVDADRLVATYRDARRSRGESVAPLELYAAIHTDRTFTVPAIRLAEAQAAREPRTFAYRVDHESPMLGGVLGACHAIELPFVFGTYDLPNGDQFAGKGPEVEALSAAMMDAWLRFAASADPGWPAYEPSRRVTRVFGRSFATDEDPRSDERRVWDGRL
ncbi:MAG TPA: carboxylesterase/lipase family protein [Myxococcota bacterium]|nr:carboxylesterase/lipase family protein [Myxococcota bacterium]